MESVQKADEWKTLNKCREKDPAELKSEAAKQSVPCSVFEDGSPSQQVNINRCVKMNRGPLVGCVCISEPR